MAALVVRVAVVLSLLLHLCSTQPANHTEMAVEVAEEDWYAERHEQRLLRDLMFRYDPRVRPHDEHNTPTTVTLALSLYQILDVQNKYQTIEIYVGMTEQWEDPFLVWDPAEYGDIDNVVLPLGSTWTPDTYFYNSVKREEEHINVHVRVGHVKKMYPAIYTFSCKLYVRWFPFDRQSCRLTFASWTMDLDQLNYTTRSGVVNTDNYVPNDEWQLVSFAWHREEVQFACCANAYAQLHATLVIERKSLFYLVNLVLPTAIITLVSIFGFFLPSNADGDRDEKVTLGITTLLAMSILLLMVTDSMPATNDFVPLMGWFLLAIIVLISTGTVLTCVVSSLAARKQTAQPVPAAMRLVFIDGLGPCLRVPATHQLQLHWTNSAQRCGAFNVGGTARLVCIISALSGVLQGDVSRYIDDADECASVRSCAGREWQYVADVLDRLLLLVYTGSTCAVSLAVCAVGSAAQSSSYPTH